MSGVTPENKTGQDSQTSVIPNQQGAVPGTTAQDATGTGDPLILKGKEHNVLHNYRSWNYVFTLSALEDSALSDPSNYAVSSKKYIILKSSGKGTTTISNKLSQTIISNTETNQTELVGLINDFNKNSPGRFDMFIDNVKINTLMSYSPQGGTSLPRKFSFSVYEPYSMGGFLEALQTASSAAGAVTYPSGHFCLRMDFYGYKDTAQGPDGSPELIPDATRFFPCQITGVTVETTDKGTSYQVQCNSINDKAFGTPNSLKNDIKMVGTSVGEVLTDFFNNLNAATDDEAKENKGPETKNKDKYEIYFAKAEAPGTTVVSTKNGQSAEWKEIGSIYAAHLNNELRSNPVYAFVTPDQAKTSGVGYVGQETATTNSANSDNTIKLEPGKNQISFAKGSQISEVIEAVIRDSEYTKNMLKSVEQAKKGDGIVTYFMIRTDVEALPGSIDPQGLATNKLYRFVVCPYRIHYTQIPGEQLGVADYTPISNQIRRTYDYFYMGKNKDVINFNLKFNHLYFQAMPPRTGNVDSSAASQGGAAGNTQIVTAPTADIDTVKDKGNPTPRVMSIPAGFVAANGISGQPRQVDPYHQLAQSMHNAITSSVDLNKCQLEIYGDPYYLVTGGVGNQIHPLKDLGMTTNGEAPMYSGDCYVNVNWRTPIDYDTFEKGGAMYFESQVLPFSGIYKVTEVNSDLNQGVFKQTLTLLRMQGQLIEAKKIDTKPGFKSRPAPGQQQVKDIAPVGVQSSGSRPNDLQLASLIRGLPGAGAFGSLPNFVNAAGGGIGGLVGAVTGGLNSIAGVGGAVQNIVGQVKTIAPQLGINVGSSISGINNIAQGIRLATSGVSNIVGGVANLGPATVASVNNILGGVLPTANSVATLAAGVTNQITAAGGTISGLAGSAVANISGQADSLLNNVKSNITAITAGIPKLDPSGIASSLGIDPSQLSGLDPSIQSKVFGQLQAFQSSIPSNVDLNSFKTQGLVMANLNLNNVGNLPPVQIDSLGVDTQAALSKISAGSLTAGGVANPLSSANLPGIAGLNQLTNTVGQAASGLTQALGQVSPTALTDKLTASQASLNNLVGSTLNVSNGLAGLLPAQAGLGSKESNIAAVNNMVQGVGGTDLSRTASSVFGNNRTTSPLDTLVSSANQGNLNNGWGEG